MFALHSLYYLYFLDSDLKIGSDIYFTELVLIIFPGVGFLKYAVIFPLHCLYYYIFLK